MMKTDKKIFYLGLALYLFIHHLTGIASLHAETDPFNGGQEFSEIPAEVSSSLDYMLQVLTRQRDSFDSSRVAHLLDFAASASGDGRNFRPNERDSGKGIFLRMEIEAPLERILNYAYNPSIPNYVVYPSVLRLCGWYAESDIITGKYELWNELGRLKKPLVLRGKEFEVNTPDSFSGAYYRYDNRRLVVLLRYKTGHALISASRMIDKSQVGKKAVIIDDLNWNYFYSGINGLNLRFIGGLDTYLYGSESVIVYYQTDDARPMTTISLFKWLKAGWAGLNVVQPGHIYEGSIRFAQGLKKVMESNMLPSPEAFARHIEYIRSLSVDERDAMIREYAHNFEHIAKDNKEMADQDFAEIIANGGYAKVLNHEEREGVLILESLKNFVGKPSLINWKAAAARDAQKISMIRHVRRP